MANNNSSSSYFSEIQKKIATLQYDIPRLSNDEVRKKKETSLRELQEELNALVIIDEEEVV